MINYRENAYIPPPPPAPPSILDRLVGVIKWSLQLAISPFISVAKWLRFHWRFDRDSFKGFGVVMIFLGFFLCCCYGIAAGDITITAPSDSDDSFHHDHHHHDSHLHRSMFHSSSRRSRSSRRR